MAPISESLGLPEPGRQFPVLGQQVLVGLQGVVLTLAQLRPLQVRLGLLGGVPGNLPVAPGPDDFPAIQGHEVQAAAELLVPDGSGAEPAGLFSELDLCLWDGNRHSLKITRARRRHTRVPGPVPGTGNPTRGCTRPGSRGWPGRS